jgi:DNA-binding transcriptional LysR family regulator
MFEKLFAESGLSLDRVRALLEVGASGSIVKAADRDPVKQSQYSRQIKELEDFFRTKLIERHESGMRLTANGKELARISRFFLLGLSNFQRGCLAEEQVFRIGASATFTQAFLAPVLCNAAQDRTRYISEVASPDDIERRLHDLTLDFGITTRSMLSRPLQVSDLGEWRLKLCIPKTLHREARAASRAFKQGDLPLVVSVAELDGQLQEIFNERAPHVICESFVTALAAVREGKVAAMLPDFLSSSLERTRFIQIDIPESKKHVSNFRLAWNPRLLRLNPHVERTREFLAQTLAGRMKSTRRNPS